ncbi:MAG TPA: nicotinamide riboside transporter PnuC [Thermoanaerobaculia bacterium]|nr:nicotinamide riboside transporter PnuC [Thermoanaerobaculia bacterium]
MSKIEILATLFGVAAVWLTVKRHIACWPASLLQVSLYVYVFFQAKLYSDMGLHVIYVVLALYGWFNWSRKKEEQGELTVVELSPRALAAWCGVSALGAGTLGWLLSRYTDAALPYWDSAITSMSLVAQWLTTRKVLENWLFWIAVDVLGIGVYYAKQLYPTTALYALFLGLATAGYFAWRKAPREQPAPAPA